MKEINEKMPTINPLLRPLKTAMMMIIMKATSMIMMALLS
jgi:hypothetical protein